MSETKFLLSEKHMPTAWYNILPDLPKPLAPPLHPGTGQPLGPARPGAHLPDEPDRAGDDAPSARSTSPTRSSTSTGSGGRRPSSGRGGWRRPSRPRPTSTTSTRASARRAATSRTPPSPRPTTTRRPGIRRIATETGAGQWGSALALACHMFGLECTVYMVKVSYEQKPYRRSLMRAWGGEVIASPSDRHQRRARRSWPRRSRLARAAWASRSARRSRTPPRDADTNYALGSVLNHVLLHQTVIGLEAQAADGDGGRVPRRPHRLRRRRQQLRRHRLPVRCATSSRARRLAHRRRRAHGLPDPDQGVYAYDFGDTAKLTPLVKMYTLGHDFMPAGIHAGGLRYHGASPLVSHLLDSGPDRGGGRARRSRSSRPRSCSRARRGSSRRRSRRTPSARPSTRRCGARRGQAADDPLQPERPRPLRPRLLRRLPRRASSRTTSTPPRPSRGR